MTLCRRSPIRITTLALACLCLSASLQSSRVGAQLPDDTVRAAARSLADEGEALAAKGKYAEAIDRFSRAFDLVKAPTIALRHAQCLEKIGRLVEARERYLEITRAPLAANAPDVFKKAVATAEKSATSLDKRIPNVEVSVQGDDLPGAELTVDGKAIPKALWGVKLPLDPGKHRIELQKGERGVSKELAVEEGESGTIALTLPGIAPHDKAVESAVTSKAGAAPKSTQGEESSSGAARSLGWISLGIGGVGLLVGATAGGMALSKRSSLNDSCPESHCPASLQSDVDSYDRTRTISTIGFAVGVVGTGAGLALLLTSSPSGPKQAGPTASAYVGVGTLGVRGSF